MAKIKFGPGGLGPVKDAIENLEEFHRLGLRACEIEFVHSVYIKKREDAEKIGKRARELGISLSIHASYYVNLNATEPEKIEGTKKRILGACEVGHYLGARSIVFHPGYYSKMSSEDAAFKIIEGIKDIQKVIKEKGWNVELCPETMGKVNVFGSIEEIRRLVDATGCSFCIDFAHILARNGGEYTFDKISKTFSEKKWHCHFSGIEYGEKGERNHIPTPKSEWEKVLKFLKKLDKEIVIICESPNPVLDSVKGKEIWKEIKD